jgi:hypothetical protein
LEGKDALVSFYGNDGLQFVFFGSNIDYNTNINLEEVKNQQDLIDQLVAYIQAYPVDFITDWCFNSMLKPYSSREEVYAEMVKHRELINFLIDGLKSN